MFIFTGAFVFIIFLSSLVPLTNWGHWSIRFFDFPRMHFIFLNVLGFYFVQQLDANLSLKLIATLMLSIALLLDLYRIFPYLPIFPKASKPARKGLSKKQKISFISVNVRQKNSNYQKLMSLVEERDPDMVLLLEADDDWVTGVAELSKTYKYSVLEPKDNTYGMLLYSKLELQDVSIKNLVDKNVISIFAKVKLASEDLIRFICLHPRPPTPAEGPSDQRDGELMKVADFISKEKQASIVAGDFNDVAWSHTTRLFLRLSGLLDPRKGRGMFNTFPAGWGWLGFPLDHVFHSKQLFISEFSKLRDIDSDHHPVFASFYLDEDHMNAQEQNEKKPKDDAESTELKKRSKDWTSPEKKPNN